jgi:hypothetical protein
MYVNIIIVIRYVVFRNVMLGGHMNEFLKRETLEQL